MNSDLSALKISKLVYWVIWAALLSSVIIYVIVLKISGPGVDVAPPQSEVDLRAVLLVVAIGAVGVSFAIRLFIMPRFMNQSDDAQKQRLFSSFIISLGLAESAAVYGLVLGMTGEPFNQCVIFFALGFIAITLQAPKFLHKSKGDDERAKLRQG